MNAVPHNSNYVMARAPESAWRVHKGRKHSSAEKSSGKVCTADCFEQCLSSPSLKEFSYAKGMENYIDSVRMDRGRDRSVYDGFYHRFRKYIQPE